MIKSRVQPKILYDRVDFAGDSYKSALINPFTGRLPGDLQESQYSELHAHYLFIVNSDKRIIDRIKQRVLAGLVQIAEQETLGKGRNCEFWRVSSPLSLNLRKTDIYNGKWDTSSRLHEKNPEQLKV